MGSTEQLCYEVPEINDENFENIHNMPTRRNSAVKDTPTPDSINMIQVDNLPETHEPDSTVAEDLSQDSVCTIVEGNIPNRNNLRHKINMFDEIFKENKILIDFIEKCLDMENSQGMLRVINRTLIPIYKDADNSYKKSAHFEKVLTNAIRKLEICPDRKFSHIKDVCDIFKSKKTKKRVAITTLSNKTSGSHFKKFKDHTKSIEVPTVINLDDEDDDVIVIDDGNDNSNKESSINNNVINACKEISNTLVVNQGKDKVTKKIGELNICSQNNDITSPSKISNPGDLLEPKLPNEHDAEVNVATRVHNLENQIAIYKKIVEELDEKEVCEDNVNSPYVVSELYKEKIVALYKEICKLTGSKAVKHHKVRLQVSKGHPEGPMKCLEEFINDNIDEYGNPPFPDLLDVTQCVTKANIEYNLGWNRKQILAEARALFVHYGKAMKKRRQKREWRDLMMYVKEEIPDPADENEALQARLYENTMIARRNEDELFERFTKMENSKSLPDPELRLSMDKDGSDIESDSESNLDMPSVSNTTSETVTKITANCERIKLKTYEEGCNGKLTENVSLYVQNDISNNLVSVDTATEIHSPTMNSQDDLNVSSHVQLSKTTVLGSESNSASINKNDTLEVNSDIEINNTKVTSNESKSEENCGTELPINNNNEMKQNNLELEYSSSSECSRSIPVENDKDSNFEVSSSTSRELKNTDAGSSEIESNSIIVKKEPEDIPFLLEQLGENFTATIMDIEDPFLVIEISDSSESESEES